MAKKQIKVYNPVKEGATVGDFLGWVLREIEAELEVSVNSIRLLAIKYEIERYREEYRMLAG